MKEDGARLGQRWMTFGCWLCVGGIVANVLAMVGVVCGGFDAWSLMNLGVLLTVAGVVEVQIERASRWGMEKGDE